MPKILPFHIPMRAAVRVTQLVEQLVEVPTIISYSSLLRTVEHYVDIPVPGGGGPSSGLQGFSSGQSSTASPSSKKRISERIVVQIVDPVSSGRLHGSLPGQGSSSSHSPAGVEERADEPRRVPARARTVTTQLRQARRSSVWAPLLSGCHSWWLCRGWRHQSPWRPSFSSHPLRSLFQGVLSHWSCYEGFPSFGKRRCCSPVRHLWLSRC